MTISEKLIQKVSKYNEKVAERQLKKMRFSVQRLDRQGPKKRPEFLVSDTKETILVAEVKTIFSGGYLGDRDAHLSTVDPNFLNSGVYSHRIDFYKMEENLRNSVDKYHSLITDSQEYKNLPFLVVFFFDFFADHFALFPRRMEEFPDVSGIVKIVRDHELNKAARKLSKEELTRRIGTGDMKGLPAPSKDFELVENECARISLPNHFVEGCITYD